MTWNSEPTNQPAWTVDLSLESAGNSALWGYNGAGTWDTGGDWNYALLTAASLTYTNSGLQLVSLTYTQTATGLSPSSGASVTIAPVSGGTNNVVVTGPASSVSIGRTHDLRHQFAHRVPDAYQRRFAHLNRRDRQCGRRPE